MLNIAIIGCGNIAPAHAEGYLAFKNRCKIVALVDIYPEKAQKMNERFNLGAAVFDSVEAMLAAVSGAELAIDLVSNCTPPYVHAQIAIDCMDAGINVLVEKPMATCLEECDRMLAAQKRSGVILAVGAQNRFRDSVNKLKILVDSGIAGKVLCAHINSLWWRGHCYYDLWWRGTYEKEGGGPTLNHAVHHIDMLNWIQNELPAEVTAVLANVAHDNSEVEDLSFAVARYRSNALAEITSSVVHHGEEQGIVLQCEHAKIAAPFSCVAEKSKPNGFGEPNHELIAKITAQYEALPNLPYEGFTGEIDNVLTAVSNGTSPLITGEEGRKTVELITAIYKSGFLKQTVSLPITENDEFYTFDGILKNAVRFYKKEKSVVSLGNSDITFGRYKKL
jgi:predicted dehydrogenase